MTKRIAAIAALAIATGLIVGCGGGGSDTKSETAASGAADATGGAAKAKPLQITMNEFSFTPKDPTAKAGKVTIVAPNAGKLEHELVLFKTDKSPTELPKAAGGSVNEDALNKDLIGELPDVPPGGTKTDSFDLKPGSYVMICNIPGHFSQGMYGTLTVK